ncbi:MAG: NYN domain-containing protein [Eggerthellaceae bacterium]|nr:NYN domain-containing protein [Eggerthellaceae bacterium]
MYARKRLLIVDGYNVLRSSERYRNITDRDYTDNAVNPARDALINDVSVYAGKSMDAVIVFDGANNPQSFGEETKIAGVRVIFSPAGQLADKVIEKLAHDARKNGIETCVVSSDKTIQDTVVGDGVDRMSANGFAMEMESIHEEVKQDSALSTAKKNTVASRIPADVLEKLKAMRDGR